MNAPLVVVRAQGGAVPGLVGRYAPGPLDGHLPETRYRRGAAQADRDAIFFRGELLRPRTDSK